MWTVLLELMYAPTARELEKSQGCEASAACRFGCCARDA